MFAGLINAIVGIFRKLRPALVVIGALTLFLALSMGSYALYDYFVKGQVQGDFSLYSDGQADAGGSSADCNVLGINLHGEMLTYIPKGNSDSLLDNQDVVASEDVMARIDQAEQDDTIKAIILEVDSGGGSPVAGEEIAQALKQAKKPTVGLIRDIGASSAYWAVTGTQRIFASKNSSVGSIGVTSSFAEEISKDSKFIQLSTGKFKDSGNPDKPFTEEEKVLYMRDVNIIFQNFIDVVAQNRGLSKEKVRALADGSTVLGDSAKALGLIDEIGNFYDVKKYLEDKLGEPVTVCWS